MAYAARARLVSAFILRDRLLRRPTDQPPRATYDFRTYVETLCVPILKVVDPTRIELATDALQVLLAPKVHASPSMIESVSSKQLRLSGSHTSPRTTS